MTNNIEKLAEEILQLRKENNDLSAYDHMINLLKQFAEAYAAEKQRQQEHVAMVMYKDGMVINYSLLQGVCVKDGWNKLYTTPPDQSREIEHWKMIAADQKLLIEGLKGECKDLGVTDICVALAKKDTQIKELQANINTLREALEYWSKVINYQYSGSKEAMSFLQQADYIAEQALSKTPAQCLQEHDNEVIERCAETAYTFLDDPYLSGHGYATGCSGEILALKGKQNGN